MLLVSTVQHHVIHQPNAFTHRLPLKPLPHPPNLPLQVITGHQAEVPALHGSFPPSILHMILA